MMLKDPESGRVHTVEYWRNYHHHFSGSNERFQVWGKHLIEVVINENGTDWVEVKRSRK